MPVEPLPAPGFSDDVHLHALHTAVNCYLSTLDSVANALANACPAIGGLYRHRLSRLRARLAFDSSAPALEESADAVEEELVEYGLKASAYVEQHRLELRSTISVLEEIVLFARAPSGFLRHSSAPVCCPDGKRPISVQSRTVERHGRPSGSRPVELRRKHGA